MTRRRLYSVIKCVVGLHVCTMLNQLAKTRSCDQMQTPRVGVSIPNFATGACGAAAKVDRDEPESASEGVTGTAEAEEGWNDSEGAWEEVSDGDPVDDPPAVEGPLLISLEKGLVAPPKRQGVTKEERQATQRLHRAHLLCLLGRALLYDAAVDDPTLQVGGWVREHVLIVRWGAGHSR